MKLRLVAIAAVLSLIAFACGDDDSADTTAPPAPDAARGMLLFEGTCVVCHGEGGAGVSGLGTALIDNEFVQSLTDQELVAFLIEGRASDHPDNTTGVAMPPRGANPGLTDTDLLAIVTYLRTLQG
jgi:disulfide bond formation protein DsbB